MSQKVVRVVITVCCGDYDGDSNNSQILVYSVIVKVSACHGFL